MGSSWMPVSPFAFYTYRMRARVLLFTLILSQSAVVFATDTPLRTRRSNDAANCGTQAKRDPLLNAISGEDLVGSTLRSVGASDVEAAKCLRSLPTESEIADWFKARTEGLEARFKELVPEGANLPPEVSACADKICAANTIFGERVGSKLLYILDRYGFNASELAINKIAKRYAGKADTWGEAEINSVLLGLMDSEYLPEQPSTRRPLMRYKRGESIAIPQSAKVDASLVGEDYCVGANTGQSGFQFFDCFFNQSSSVRRSEAFHEISHHHAERNGFEFESDEGALSSNAKEWLALSSWTKVSGEGAGTKWRSENQSCLVSGYSQEGPHEDLAEAMGLYRYNPARLKQTCPQKYEYLKSRLFGGREYLNSKQCQRTSSR